MALWETGCPETKHFLEESATSKKFLRRANLFNGLEDAHLEHQEEELSELPEDEGVGAGFGVVAGGVGVVEGPGAPEEAGGVWLWSPDELESDESEESVDNV